VTPANAAAAGFSVAPLPPINAAIIGSRRSADRNHRARRRRQNGVGLGLWLQSVM